MTSTISTLNNRTDLQLVTDSQDTSAIRFDFGPEWIGFEYDSYFVKVTDGEYEEIWGFCGTVPYLSKLVTRVA